MENQGLEEGGHRISDREEIFPPDIVDMLFPDRHELHACADKLNRVRAGGFSYFTLEELEAKRKAIDDLNKIIYDLAKVLAVWANEVVKIFESRGEKMIKRTCPLCGKAWLSSVSQEDWNCQQCGYLLATNLNEEASK
jgi:ribosomal protein S27AE